MVEHLSEHGAQLEHLESFPAYRVPRTNFDRALHALTEIPFKLSRDGRRRAMLEALDNQATWGQIKHWRAGRRQVPRWAIEMLKRKLARRQESSGRGLAELERVA